MDKENFVTGEQKKALKELGATKDYFLGQLMIEHFSRLYLSGHAEALLWAVAWSTWTGAELREEVCADFWRALTRWENYDVLTLDAAFSVARKGQRQADRKRHCEHGLWILFQVDDLRSKATDEFPNGMPIDEAFRVVSEDRNMSDSTVRAIYYGEKSKIEFARSLYDERERASEAIDEEK